MLSLFRQAVFRMILRIPKIISLMMPIRAYNTKLMSKTMCSCEYNSLHEVLYLTML